MLGNTVQSQRLRLAGRGWGENAEWATKLGVAGPLWICCGLKNKWWLHSVAICFFHISGSLTRYEMERCFQGTSEPSYRTLNPASSSSQLYSSVTTAFCDNHQRQ
jgi:hypothetical protein